MNIVIVIEYKENVKKKPHQTELTREIQFQYFKLCLQVFNSMALSIHTNQQNSTYPKVDKRTNNLTLN